MNKDFGAFELKQKIGQGGMASVYLATQKALQRPVVLKILYPHLAEEENLVQRFEREARAAARLKHENIIQVIDMGRHEDVAYIAMEFVEGMDLKKWLEAHGTPPMEMALLMLRDLCRGLEHAHANHIIHRDIKPANVMLTPDGTIKLMDFGLARSGSETATQMTLVGSVMGTPAYMSPEQATGEVVDERSDIFSAGVLAYELLGGTRPFTGDSYSTVLRSILTVEPPEVTHFNPLVPEEVARVIRGTLQKDVSKRFQKISTLREGLEEVIEQMGLHRGKDLLREYVADPEAAATKWRQKRLSRHLDQGLYYENMGLGKIDDALLEFRRVLYLDPRNTVAKDHVKKLEREREKLSTKAAPPEPAAEGIESTLVLTPEQLAASAQTVEGKSADPVTPVKPPAPTPPKPAPQPAPPKPPPPKPAPPKPAPKPVQGVTHSKDAARKEKKGGLPVPLLAAAGVLLVAILAFGITRMIGGRDATESPVVENSVESPPVAMLPADTMAAPAAPAIPAADTAVVSPLIPAQEAFRASNWAEAARLANGALASKDLPRKDRRAARELLARALIRDRRQAEASKAFSDLLRAFPAYTPPSDFTSEERASFETARLNRVSALGGPDALPTPQTPPAAPPAPAATATINVKVTPFASSFAVDGKVMGENKGSFTAAVTPGRHTVTIKHPTLGTRDWTVEVGSGDKKDLTHDFSVAAGSVSVSSEPTWGDIYVDGVRVGHTTPWEVKALTPGRHEIALVREGWTVDGGAKVVEVRAGVTTSVKFKLKQRK